MFVFLYTEKNEPVNKRNINHRIQLIFRLLSQGADPNYYHPEKNSTPLQVRVHP